jgi:hypothetical protein
MAKLAITRDIGSQTYNVPMVVIEAESGSVSVRMDKASDVAEHQQLIETLSSLILGEVACVYVQQLPGSEWGDEWMLGTGCGHTLRIHRDEANDIRHEAALRLAELMLMPNQSLPHANEYAAGEL